MPSPLAPLQPHPVYPPDYPPDYQFLQPAEPLPSQQIVVRSVTNGNGLNAGPVMTENEFATNGQWGVVDWAQRADVAARVSWTGITEMPSNIGTYWYVGTGAPGQIADASPGDLYLDSESGLVYQLGQDNVWTQTADIQGPPGPPLTAKGTVPSQVYLPYEADPGDMYVTTDTGHAWVWNGSLWVDMGIFQGAPGAAGLAATVDVGPTTTVAPTVPASVTNTGTPNAAVFHFSIPQGQTGIQGQIGPVGPPGPAGTTIATNTSANFTQPAVNANVAVTLNSGLGIAPGLILYIQGGGYYSVQSIAGNVATLQNLGYSANVVAGTVINSGASVAGVGPAGAAASITVGTTSTGAAGSQALVTNTGTQSAAVFNFTIPQGNVGQTGQIGPVGPPGQNGQPGTAGTRWFNGVGAPGTITGSAPGDYYLDVNIGDVYVL
jgi:hypothetical protein